MKFAPFASHSNNIARRIIRSIISANPSPLSTQQIYKLAVKHEEERKARLPESRQQPVGATLTERHKDRWPPHPGNIIRSMSYLKNVVLPDLVQRNEIEKVHTTRTLSPEEIEQRLQTMTKAARRNASLTTLIDVWLWRQKPKTEPPPQEAPPEVYGKEVGVDEDWSHLNKRRQRSRELKVQKDVGWMRQLDKARAEGAAFSEEAPSSEGPRA